MKNKLLVLIIAAQMQAFGTSLRNLDSDNKGNDDIAGQILQIGGNAINAFGNGDDKGFKKYLRLIADSIYEFLGLTQPGQQS